MYNSAQESRSDRDEELGLFAILFLHMLGGTWAVNSGTAATAAVEAATSTASPSTAPTEAASV